MLSGRPLLSHFEDLTFTFTVHDKQGAGDSKAITIPLSTNTETQGKVHCLVFNPYPSENIYYVKIESEKDVAFKYNVYSLTGALVASSSNQNLKEGTWYLPIDMSHCSTGVYIFVGMEDNSIRHSIKFLKY